MSSDSEQSEYEMYNSLTATSRRIAQEIEQSKSINCQLSPSSSPTQSNNLNNVSKPQSRSSYQSRRLTPIIITDSHLNNPEDDESDGDLMTTPIRTATQEVKHQIDSNSPSPSTPSPTTNLSQPRPPTVSILTRSSPPPTCALPPTPEHKRISTLEKKITKETEESLELPINESNLMNPRPTPNGNPSIITPRKSLIPNPSVSRARVRLASIGIGIRPKTAPLQPNTAASQINKPSTTTSTNRISKLPTATHPIRRLNQAETSALKEGKLKHKSSLQQIINSSTSSNDISNHNNSVNRTIPLKKSVCDLVAKFDKDHKPKLSDQKSINQLNERIRKRSLIGYGSSVGGGSIQGIEKVENEEVIKVLEKTKKTNHSPSPSTSTARASTSSRTSDRWIEENPSHSPSPSHYDQNHQESLTNCINQSNQQQQQQPLSTNHSFITNSNQSSNHHHHHHHHSNLNQNPTNPQSSETHHSFSMAISSPPHQSNSTQSQQPQPPQPSQSQPSQSSSLLNTSSHQQTNPNSNNNSNRAVRPRRSAASLHSIPERRSKEVDQPPLPVPPTPWVEPATPMLNPPIRQASSSTSVSEKSPHHSSFNIHPSHLLSPNDSNPDTDFIPLDSPLPWSTQDTSFPTTPPATTNPPGLRDQRLLSRYRATSQSLSTRHSEGSRYATSSSVWTPSSVAGSRLGFDSVDHGARTSVASRDSRFTAETDYEDYCPKVLPHPTSSASARSIHLAMSASWHGQQPEHLFNRPSSSPFTAQAVPLAPNPASEHLQRPTIASLMNVEEQSEMVGLGITSDEVVSVSRNSRSPSLTGRLPDSWRPSTQNLTPSNKLSAPTSNPHTNTSSSSFNTLSSSGLDSPRSRSATPIMEPPSSTPLSNISIKTHSLGLAVNPPQSVTSPSTSEGNSLSRAPSLHQKQLDLEQDQSNSGSGFNDPTDASKAHFYQRHHQAHWDDLDDGSPILASSAVIPSRAVVLAEEGGRIIDFSSMKCQLEDLHVPDDTTHLLITKTQGPFILNSLLTSCLPRLTSTLVVLDISDSYLASLPSAIASCTALEELNISGNICASGDLPAWIAHLVSLKVLAADRCGLIHLVNPLGSLLHVHHLSLRSNHLKSLPSWLCHLHALEVLLVDDNEFEPPWLELAEPLLSSNYRSNESEATLPTASSASETGSLSSSLAHGLQTTRSAPGEPTNSSHLATNNGSTTTDSPGFHGRISRPTTGASDYPRASQTGSLRLSPGQNERRLEGVESLNRRNSSVRRLRSSNELRSTAARPSSYHDHSPSLASFMEAEDPHQPGSGPASVYSHPQVQSQLDVHHSLRSAPSGPMERLNASASILERFPSKGIPQGVNFPPPQPPQSRDHKKFGFLKKMSLGKLRREVTTGRERTNTLEARGGAAVPLTVYEIEPPTRPHVNPLIESPKSVSEDAVMLMSSREPLAIPTRPAMPATQSADGRGWGSHNADREAAKNRRRSFLKLEPCVGIKKFEPLPMIPTTWTHSMSDAEGMVEDLMLATSINQDQNVNHHRTSSESPSSQQHRELPSPVLSTVALSQAPHTNRSSTIDPRTGLRSIMMYLRDVHDLSGEPAAPVGVNARPGLVSRASSTKQPSSKSVNHPDFQSLNGRMYSMAGMNAMGSTLEIDSELDNSHSTSIHQSQTCSPVLPSTNSVPNETRPKVTDNPGRRLKVIEEIISTEKSYIRGLRELQDIYIASATAMSTGGIGNNKESTVPSSERKVVFNNVEAIIGFHVEVLLPDLQEVVDRLSKKQLTILAPNEIRSIAVIKKRKEQEAKSALDKTANPRLSGGEDSTTPSTIEENEEMFLERQRNEINGELIKAAAEDLAKVFIRHAAFLKLYSTYITQFDLALERLREWTVTVSHPPTITNNGLSAGASSSSSSWAPGLNAPAGMPLTTNQKKKLKTYLKRCRANPSHSQMNLESYLLMPVQRLPRYKLLLENLQSCTPDRQIPPEPTSSSSIEDPSVIMGLLPNQMVSEALSLISAVTAEMNERKRDSEGRQRLLYWQQRFGNKFRSPLVQPHRTLIKEGRVTLMRTVKLTTKDVVSSTGQNIKVRVSALSTDSQAVTMILLLCTDLLVLAKDPGDGGSGPASSPASLHQALRLAQHTRNSLTLPATVFGAEQTMVRFVDSKAIFYFQCDSQRIASEWTVAVNQQVPLL